MPSFDIVSEIDSHQLTNAIDQANRIIDTRYDFKGSHASFERDDLQVTLMGNSDMQLDQMEDILRSAVIKCSIDPKAMSSGEQEGAGKQVKKAVTFKNGLESLLAKKIIKMIKEDKSLKVQSQIQGEQVRVTGKKRDDLQQVIAMLRGADVDQPLQFNNFRD